VSVLYVDPRNNHKKALFHPFAQRAPVHRFSTNLELNIPLVDVINHNKFCDNLFRDFDYLHFCLLSDVAVISAVLRYTKPVRSSKHSNVIVADYY